MPQEKKYAYVLIRVEAEKPHKDIMKTATKAINEGHDGVETTAIFTGSPGTYLLKRFAETDLMIEEHEDRLSHRQLEEPLS